MFAFIKFIHSLSKICGIISTALIASAVLVTTQMVVVRYVFKMSTVWQTEYVIFSLAAATFIGAPYVLMKKGHVNVDLIPYYLNQKGKNILAIVAAILALLFLVVLFYSSVQLTNHAWVKNIKTPTIWNFPLWKVYIFLPLGIGILVLQYLRLTDGQGRTVDFKNTVIIMTSNLASNMIQSMSGDDYQVIKLAVMGEVKNHFRPEFINRIDEVVVFHALADDHVKSIAAIQLQYLKDRLAQLEMKVDITDAALEEISKEGFDPVYGARPLKRAIQSEIENPLAKEILAGHFMAKDTIKIDSVSGKLKFTKI